MRLLISGIFFYACLLFCEAYAQETTQPLFYIERSLNANVVHYDARITDSAMLDDKEPVIVYWILNAEDGRRESLNYIQKIKAYGIKVKPGTKRGEYTLTIVSFKDRPIRVFMNDGVVHAETDINGTLAFLEKVFIKTSGAFSKPDYIEFHGKDELTGSELVEKVVID